jgi:hypothetical protein
LLSLSFLLHFFFSIVVKGCSACADRHGWLPWGRLVSFPWHVASLCRLLPQIDWYCYWFGMVWG